MSVTKVAPLRPWHRLKRALADKTRDALIRYVCTVYGLTNIPAITLWQSNIFLTPVVSALEAVCP